MVDDRAEVASASTGDANEVARAAHAAMMDDVLHHADRTYSPAVKMALTAGVIAPLFAPDAAPATAGFLERFSSNYKQSLKFGATSAARGYLGVTGSALGNVGVDAALGAVGVPIAAKSPGMTMFDTIALSTAGIAAMRFNMLKVMGATVGAHTVARLYDAYVREQ